MVSKLKPERKGRSAAKGKDGKMQPVAAADAQVTYEWLGHVLLWAGTGLDAAIFNSCYSGEVLGDTAAPADLVEAHLFSDIRVDRDAQELRLAREDNTAPELWETIKTNAYEWCKKNHVRIYLMDA